MVRYDVILADLDDTLFDFSASARQALAETLSAVGVPPTAALVDDYMAINQRWWERFERGEIPKDAIYVGRYAELFRRHAIDADPAAANERYKDRLWRQRNFKPGAAAAGLPRLRHHQRHHRDPAPADCRLGPGGPVRRRVHLRGAGQQEAGAGVLRPGVRHPRPGAAPAGHRPGRNAGLPTCFYGDPARADDRCDYVITDLLDFPQIIGL